MPFESYFNLRTFHAHMNEFELIELNLLQNFQLTFSAFVPPDTFSMNLKFPKVFR